MHNCLHDELYLFIPYTYQSFIFLSSLSIRLVQNRGYQHFQSVVSLCPLSLLSSWLTLQSLTSDWLNKDCLSLSTKQRYGLLKSDPEKSLRSDGLHSFKSVLVQWPHKQLGCSIPQQICFFLIILDCTAQVGVAHEFCHVTQLFIERPNVNVCLFLLKKMVRCSLALQSDSRRNTQVENIYLQYTVGKQNMQFKVGL